MVKLSASYLMHDEESLPSPGELRGEHTASDGGGIGMKFSDSLMSLLTFHPGSGTSTDLQGNAVGG